MYLRHLIIFGIKIVFVRKIFLEFIVQKAVYSELSEQQYGGSAELYNK